MSFVDWFAALALLIVGVAGLAAGASALLKRRWNYPPYAVKGTGALLIGLVYIAGALIALAVLGLMLFRGTA